MFVKAANVANETQKKFARLKVNEMRIHVLRVSRRDECAVELVRLVSQLHQLVRLSLKGRRRSGQNNNNNNVGGCGQIDKQTQFVQEGENSLSLRFELSVCEIIAVFGRLSFPQHSMIRIRIRIQHQGFRFQSH